MYLIKNQCTKPQYNLALEEFLCNKAKNENLEFFMLWQNEPSVIIGRFQNVNDFVNLKFAESFNIHIVRRNSGGGAVYHDLGNVNYSFIVHEDKNKNNFVFFSEKIIDVLISLNFKADFSLNHNDIIANGFKISGTAQYKHNGILLHHGTLLFNSDLDILQKILKKSGQVINLKSFIKENINVKDFMKNLYEKFNAETFSLSEIDKNEIEKIMHEKYLNPNWNMKGVIS